MRLSVKNYPLMYHKISTLSFAVIMIKKKKSFKIHESLVKQLISSCRRSQCSVVAKWTYTKVENGRGGFSKEFYSMIGLEDLVDNDCQKIGEHCYLRHVTRKPVFGVCYQGRLKPVCAVTETR